MSAWTGQCRRVALCPPADKFRSCGHGGRAAHAAVSGTCLGECLRQFWARFAPVTALCGCGRPVKSAVRASALCGAAVAPRHSERQGAICQPSKSLAYQQVCGSGSEFLKQRARVVSEIPLKQMTCKGIKAGCCGLVETMKKRLKESTGERENTQTFACQRQSVGAG